MARRMSEVLADIPREGVLEEGRYQVVLAKSRKGHLSNSEVCLSTRQVSP